MWTNLITRPSVLQFERSDQLQGDGLVRHSRCTHCNLKQQKELSNRSGLGDQSLLDFCFAQVWRDEEEPLLG